MNTVVKASTLPYTEFYKVLSNNLKHHDFQYHLGECVDTIPFIPEEEYSKGGLYISDINNILEFLDFGNKIVTIRLRPDEDVYIEYKKYKVHSLNIIDISSAGEFIEKHIIELRHQINSKVFDRCASNVYESTIMLLKHEFPELVPEVSE